jgi:hypothetical protein
MKKLRVKLVLTDAEARSLDYIIDNTADYPDVLAELFSGASEMKIAERALGKWRASVAVAYRRGRMDELTTNLTSGGMLCQYSIAMVAFLKQCLLMRLLKNFKRH